MNLSDFVAVLSVLLETVLWLIIFKIINVYLGQLINVFQYLKYFKITQAELCH